MCGITNNRSLSAFDLSLTDRALDDLTGKLAEMLVQRLIRAAGLEAVKSINET